MDSAYQQQATSKSVTQGKKKSTSNFGVILPTWGTAALEASRQRTTSATITRQSAGHQLQHFLGLMMMFLTEEKTPSHGISLLSSNMIQRLFVCVCVCVCVFDFSFLHFLICFLNQW